MAPAKYCNVQKMKCVRVKETIDYMQANLREKSKIHISALGIKQTSKKISRWRKDSQHSIKKYIHTCVFL